MAERSALLSSNLVFDQQANRNMRGTVQYTVRDGKYSFYVMLYLLSLL